jgi:N-formylglutamate amidohydrolase
VHALQIEIARDLYMDEGRIERLPAFQAMQKNITGFIAGLAEQAGAVLEG